jgi:hypothetical protein
MSLYALEYVMCRVHALNPGSHEFPAECFEIAGLIIHGRDIDYGPLGKLEEERASMFIEGLVLYEALRARQEGRPASFTNIVQLMRASYKLPKPETPRFTTLDVLDQMPRYPRLHNLKHLLTTWLGPSHHMPSAHALVAIEQLLRQSIAYNSDIRPKDKLMPRVR